MTLVKTATAGSGRLRIDPGGRRYGGGTGADPELTKAGFRTGYLDVAQFTLPKSER